MIRIECPGCGFAWWVEQGRADEKQRCAECGLVVQAGAPGAAERAGPGDEGKLGVGRPPFGALPIRDDAPRGEGGGLAMIGIVCWFLGFFVWPAYKGLLDSVLVFGLHVVGVACGAVALAKAIKTRGPRGLAATCLALNAVLVGWYLFGIILVLAWLARQ